MNVDRSVRASLVVSACVLGLAALHHFEPILAPVTFAVLIVALLWPLQRRLQALMLQLAAVALIMQATLVAAGSTAYLAAWAISGIARWVNRGASHLQGLYAGLAEWLEGGGLYSAGMLSDQFSMSTVLRLAREVAASLQGMSSFLLLTLVFVTLGLLEVDDLVRRVRAVVAGDDGRRLLGTGRAIALKLQ
jgi:AI-2 transport protein TqsA